MSSNSLTYYIWYLLSATFNMILVIWICKKLASFRSCGTNRSCFLFDGTIQRYLQIILNRCIWVWSTYQFKGLVSTVSTSDFQEVLVRSRTKNDIYISTNDFAMGIPISFLFDRTTTTVSTDQFKEVCLGMKQISIQESRFFSIYKWF